MRHCVRDASLLFGFSYSQRSAAALAGSGCQNSRETSSNFPQASRLGGLNCASRSFLLDLPPGNPILRLSQLKLLPAALRLSTVPIKLSPHGSSEPRLPSRYLCLTDPLIMCAASTLVGLSCLGRDFQAPEPLEAELIWISGLEGCAPFETF